MVDEESIDHTSSIKVSLSDTSKRQALDIAVCATYLALTGASGGRWSPECVHFSHDPPADRSLWQRVFRAPIEFQSSFSGFSCPSADLSIQLPLANPELVEHARGLLQLRPPPHIEEPLVEQVRRSILLLLPTGQSTLAAIAKNMAMSVRTVQRQLDAAGQTFGELLNDVRRQVVERHLSESAHSISSVAEMAGYNCVSSFSRWFNAQYGMTASEWRSEKAIGAQGPPPMWRL
jgi:AraC-like DNA-binding protein